MRRLGRTILILGACFLGAVAAPAADAPIRHRVQPGDTVPRLSWQYKIRAEAIRAANGLTGDALTPGTTILIPPTGEVSSATTAVRPAPTPARESPDPPEARPRSKPVTPAVARDEAVAMPTPYVQDLGARSSRGELRPRNAPPASPKPVESAETPRDEPPIEEINRPAAAPRGREKAAPTAPPPGREEPVMTDRRNPNFLGLSRQLASKGIAYNGSWTPPGESVSWVMDCSNTARWLYREGAGMELPRTASEQYLALDRARLLWPAPHEFLSSRINTEKLGRRLKPGDLLFWENTYKPVRRPDITHVMLYLGVDARGRWLMAGSQQSAGVNVYVFDPTAKKGGYKTFFGLFKHEGRFVAYGRPLGNG